jgi:hypothetical protein
MGVGPLTSDKVATGVLVNNNALFHYTHTAGKSEQEPGTPATSSGPQRDRRGHRDQHGSPVDELGRALFPQRAGQAGGEPGLVGGLAEQDGVGVPDQALSVRGDLQGMVPPLCNAWRRALRPGNY